MTKKRPKRQTSKAASLRPDSGGAMGSDVVSTADAARRSAEASGNPSEAGSTATRRRRSARGDARPPQGRQHASRHVRTPSDQATSRWPLVVRIVSFVAAAAFSIAGILGLFSAVRTQSAAQQITAASVRGESVRHVLVLMSYDESDPATSVERDGLLDVLGPAGIASDFFYLDARATDANPAAATRARELIEAQVQAKSDSSGRYDAIVAAGDPALAYVLERQDILQGLPVAFFAVTSEELAAQAHEAGIATGIVELGGPALALESAAGLCPDATRAVVLSDGSPEAEGLLAQLTAAAPSGLTLDTWQVQNLTEGSLSANLSQLDATSDVVLVLAANRSSDVSRTPSATAHWLASQTPSGLFSAYGGVGEGIWGSAFTNRREEASEAVTRLSELLNGASPASLPNTTWEPACAVFDAQALAAAGVDLGSIPASAALVNESTLSWRVLRPMVGPVLCLLAGLACVAVFGVIGFRRTAASRRAIVETNRSLRHRVTHDLLTDLPNRQALEAHAHGRSTEPKLRAVVQLDVEDFSDINDSYGHAFGDAVIREVARRLESLPASLAVRSAGDEFVLCADHVLTSTDPLLTGLAEAFERPVEAEGSAVELAVRCGVANRAPGTSAEELIVQADLACQSAKLGGLRTPVFYEESMRQAMERKIEITGILKRAIAEEAVDVVWQPQVSASTLEVVGYEALCRLSSAGVGPADFIPVAEMSGLVIPLGRIVTRKVVEQLAAWRAEGRTPAVASFNFSAAQLRDEGYLDYLSGLLEAHDVPAGLLKVEITESLVVDGDGQAEEFFAGLQELGVGLALDDFGTGYSSLERMASLPVGTVKLDKSLVDGFVAPGKESFVDHLCQLFHDLGKQLVVEGVETREQLLICRRLGCDVIQGYVFSRPVGAEETASFDPSSVVGELPPVEPAQGDASTPEGAAEAGASRARNKDWATYKRDANGRWTKKR